MVSLGIQPIAHKTHHTSHMHKVLGITTSSFLRVDNDIKIGERTVKMRMDRARRMVASKEDSYKRVYADDGKSYTEDDRSEDVAEAARKKENIQQMNNNIAKKMIYLLIFQRQVRLEMKMIDQKLLLK